MRGEGLTRDTATRARDCDAVPVQMLQYFTVGRGGTVLREGVHELQRRYGVLAVVEAAEVAGG